MPPLESPPTEVARFLLERSILRNRTLQRANGGMSPAVLELLNTCAPTRHFRERARERRLSHDVEDFVVTWGTSIEARRGYSSLTIVRRDLPRELRDSELARRAEGWVFVLSDTGALVTCYWAGLHAWRRLRRARDVRNHGRRAA